MNSISLRRPKLIVINKKVDHIVYAVSDLDKAIKEFEQKLGVRPVFGGYHRTFGTKNALINLNNQMYLEFLAIDNSNTEVKSPRWMGVDFLTKNQITRWAKKSNSLKPDSVLLKEYNPDMGEIRSGSRNSSDGSVLEWKLAMPLALPEVEIVPFLLDWSATEKHPSELLPDMGCELIELYGRHPKPQAFDAVFEALECTFSIRQATEIALKAVIKSPNGLIEI